MNINLDHVIPDPIRAIINQNSAIWNTSCEFKSGEFYLVDAQSGKGKSTFIQTLYGIRKDYEGNVYFDNTPISDFNTSALANFRQEKLSILFQDLRLFLGLTARENIDIKASLAKSTWYDKVEEMAERLQVGHILNKQAELLSYGERQRIATLRALCQPFKWILLDEPFSHLDKENTLASFNLIQEVAKDQGAGIIITTLGEDEFINFNHHLEL